MQGQTSAERGQATGGRATSPRLVVWPAIADHDVTARRMLGCSEFAWLREFDAAEKLFYIWVGILQGLICPPLLSDSNEQDDYRGSPTSSLYQGPRAPRGASGPKRATFMLALEASQLVCFAAPRITFPVESAVLW